jgi:hypothetical protein
MMDGGVVIRRLRRRGPEADRARGRRLREGRGGVTGGSADVNGGSAESLAGLRPGGSCRGRTWAQKA